MALGAIAATILVAAAFGTRFNQPPTVVDSPLIGQPVPDVTLPYLEKEGEVSLSGLHGGIVAINFWASWCVPCRNEHDDLVATAKAYEDRGVRFLGIVYQDKPASAVAFLDELGRGYDHLVDPDSRAAIDFGVFGVPETFFVDRDGNVVAKITGESSAQILSSTLDAILAGRRPSSRVLGEVQPQPDG
ncbi:MAG: TlpA family protein disulfide reductase [Actinomycetota bacterium]|nr:TlpA family protein disulfide reductase [Actinomycetota bacterium]